jgi:hypothetical protein
MRQGGAWIISLVGVAAVKTDFMFESRNQESTTRLTQSITCRFSPASFPIEVLVLLHMIISFMLTSLNLSDLFEPSCLLLR